MSYYKGKPKVSNKETVKQIIEYPIKAIPERGLTQETCEAYGIRTAYNQETGEPEAHYFPHYKGDKIVGFVRRDLLQPKKDAWSIIGEVNIKSELFGQHVGNDTRKITIVEGMYDAPSAYQVQMDSLKQWEKKEGKKTGIKPSVVSISLGTKCAKAQIGSQLEFLNDYKDIIVAFDSDKATPEQLSRGELYGQDAVAQLVEVLIDFKNVILDKKDPNEYLVEGKGHELSKKLAFDAKPYSPESIIIGAPPLEELMKPVPAGIKLDLLPKTSAMLKGLREAEATVVLAPAGIGKSTLVKEIQKALIDLGEPTAGIYLEETALETTTSFIALDVGVPWLDLQEKPSLVPKQQWEESYERLFKNTVWTNHFGSLEPDKVIRDMLWMSSQGHKRIFLDHISMVFSGRASNRERQDIDNMLTDIAALVKRTGIHPIIVSHIKRDKPVIEEDNQGRKWLTVRKTDARGSGAFEQLFWNCICLEPEVTEDGSAGLLRIRIDKNRRGAKKGIADVLKYDDVTGRLRAIG